MASGLVKFGKELRDAEFLLDPTSVHINQGSWGCTPRKVFNAQTRLKEKVESQPDTHFRRHREKAWFDSLKTVCSFLKLNPENVAFVDNCTSGINCVMQSLPLNPGDQILLYSWTYKAIAYTAYRIAERTGAEIVKLELEYPIQSKEDVVEKYRTMFKENPKIKVAVLDYISSPTATLFPMEELVKLCKEFDVISVVDGAHTPGQIEINIESMMPDFYAGNLHKWVFCPRSSAILWVNPKHHDIITPVVTSHAYKQKPWQYEFYTQGTRDDTAFLTSVQGVEFFQSLGGREALTSYVKPMLEDAVGHLVEKWGTRKFAIPKDMEAPYMKLIRLPDSGYYTPTGSKEVYGDLDNIMSDLYHRFNIHTVTLVIQDEPWIRLSGTAYNTPQEYEKLADAVLTLCSEHPPS